MSAVEAVESQQSEVLETGRLLDNLLGYMEDDDFPFLRTYDLPPDLPIGSDE